MREEDYYRYERDYFDRNYDIRNGEPRTLMDALTGGRREDAQTEIPANIVICYPKSYGDVRILIDSLKHRQPIIANLAKISEGGAQRILDFMSGAVYALSGSMHRITASLFLLTPEGMSIKIPTDIETRLKDR